MWLKSGFELNYVPPLGAICWLEEKLIVQSLSRKSRLLQTLSHALALRLLLNKIDLGKENYNLVNRPKLLDHSHREVANLK